MDREQIERLEALLAKVPQGAWECHPTMTYAVCLPDDSYLDITRHPSTDEDEMAVRDLIVEAINALPALLQLARAVSEAPKARAPIYALGAQIVSATVFMDEQIDAQRISGQTVALVPVPVKEGE